MTGWSLCGLKYLRAFSFSHFSFVFPHSFSIRFRCTTFTVCRWARGSAHLDSTTETTVSVSGVSHWKTHRKRPFFVRFDGHCFFRKKSVASSRPHSYSTFVMIGAAISCWTMLTFHIKIRWPHLTPPRLVGLTSSRSSLHWHRLPTHCFHSPTDHCPVFIWPSMPSHSSKMRGTHLVSHDKRTDSIITKCVFLQENGSFIGCRSMPVL